MKYKIYTTSKKTWDAMIEAIDQAQKSIYIEMYIFLDDTSKSHDFIGKLRQKSQAGISVIVVVDALGSRAIKKETVDSMRKSGIEFLFFSNWLRHIHRKILIVDEKTSFIGGVNIGKSFMLWNDLQIKIRGRITNNILKSFAYTYEMAGGKNKKILDFKNKKLAFKLKSKFIEHWPIKNIYSLKKSYVEKITNAKKSIKVITPYFTPPRWFISLLDDALRRGVKVEILIPEKVEWKIFTSLNYRFMHKLHAMGINFFLTRKMNHAKLLIIDDKECLLGSQNIDLLSFNLNSEIGIFFQEKEVIDELLFIFERWKRNSFKFEPKNYKMRPIDYFVFAIAKILRPIL